MLYGRMSLSTSVKNIQKIFHVSGEAIPYTIKRHHASRRLRLTLRPNGAVLVTIPRRASVRQAEQFVESQAEWIARQRDALALRRPEIAPSIPPYHAARFRALRFVRQKVRQWHTHYPFVYKKIIVRSQSTRWGSCSRTGTLSFNYRLFFLPEELADYVVVHELCHLAEMNHSRRFWALVGSNLPNYRRLRHELKKYHCG